MDTSFVAVPEGRKLKITGANVDSELFEKGKKNQELLAADNKDLANYEAGSDYEEQQTMHPFLQEETEVYFPSYDELFHEISGYFIIDLFDLDYRIVMERLDAATYETTVGENGAQGGYLAFGESIKGCSYISMPVVVVKYDEYDYSEMEWLSAFLVDEDVWYSTDGWVFNEEDMTGHAVLRMASPVEVKGILVMPSEEPENVLNYTMGYAVYGGDDDWMEIAFETEESAMEFYLSLERAFERIQ